MKLKILVSAAIISFGISGFAQDHNHHSHGKKSHSDHSMHKGHGAKGKVETLSGNLIGMTCFIKHGSSGVKHKSCAKSCAEKGLPIGLKADDGKLYFVSGKGHDSLIESYKPLLKYLESKVKVQAEVFEKDGQRMIVINKIKKG